MLTPKTSIIKIVSIIGSIVITSLTLSQFAKLIKHILKVNYNWNFEFFMIIGMVFFQLLFILKKPAALKIDYCYNLLLISLLGSLMLLPLVIFNQFYNCSDVVNLAYFFSVVLVMFFKHKERVAKLKLPAILSFTWVLYRLIILLFIL